MSVKLTTNLSQRLVLTPQLRQRIEMLQMTSIELSDLIQQQLLENPVLEEVQSQEEIQELAEKILDQHAGADPSSNFDFDAAEGVASTNGSGDADAALGSFNEEATEFSATGEGAAEGGEEDFGSDLEKRDAF